METILPQGIMCLSSVVDCIIDLNYSLLYCSIAPCLSLMIGGGVFSFDFGLGYVTLSNRISAGMLQTELQGLKWPCPVWLAFL